MPVYFQEIKNKMLAFQNSRGDKCVINLDDCANISGDNEPSPALRFRLKNGSDFTIEMASVEELERALYDLTCFVREARREKHLKNVERRAALKRKIQELKEEIRKADIAS